MCVCMCAYIAYVYMYDSRISSLVVIVIGAVVSRRSSKTLRAKK